MSNKLPERLISTAEVLPWVPIIGHSVRLIGQDNKTLATLNIMPMNTDSPHDRALQIADEIVLRLTTHDYA